MYKTSNLEVTEKLNTSIEELQPNFGLLLENLKFVRK